MREDLAATFSLWREEASSARIPDVEREWHAVRRRIRGGSEAGEVSTARRSRGRFAWVALPLGAAAALTLALVRPTAPAVAEAPVQTAYADSVEAPGNNTSTMVFVDDKSGWVIVLASDASPKQG